MSHSDRSRSPTSRRSGSALSRADLPGFPVWRGPPMGSAVRTCQAMSNPQIIPNWSGPLSGSYHSYQPQLHVRPMLHSTLSQPHPFPPTPLMHRPPGFLPSSPPPPSIPAPHLLNLALRLSLVHRLLLITPALHALPPALPLAPLQGPTRSLPLPRTLASLVLTSTNTGSQTKITTATRRSMA